MAIGPQKGAYLLGAGLLLLLALGGAVVKRSGGVGKSTPPESGDTGAELPPGKHDRARSSHKRSAEDIQRLAEQWYQEILAKHPEMAVTFKDVPDERNGFLQLLNFMDRFGRYGSDGLPLPENIIAIINGRTSWDAAALAGWLEENRLLLDEIVAIGLLSDQSVKGIDMERLKFFSARLPNECSKLLLAHARLAMEQGDEHAALQSTRAAMGLADHMDQMELPSLLSKTISILIRQNTRKAIIDHLLVADGTTAPDLAAWQGLLTRNQETPADLAKAFFGEWHHSTRSFLLVGLLGDPDHLAVLVDTSGRTSDPSGRINDPDAVVEAHLTSFSQLMSRMKESDLNELPGISANPPDTTGLSGKGAELLNTLFMGTSAWSKGWTRSQTDAAIVYAAFQAANGGQLPLEPYTGKPFIFDQKAGTVRVPNDPWFEDMDYQPVKIPVIRQR